MYKSCASTYEMFAEWHRLLLCRGHITTTFIIIECAIQLLWMEVLAIHLHYFLESVFFMCISKDAHKEHAATGSSFQTLIISHLCVCRLYSVTENNKHRMPRAAQLTHSSHQEKRKKKNLSCCDKLCRWLNTAIRQHTVCLTKCFLSNTHELSWPLAAWFQVFIRVLLWGSVSIRDGFGFCHHCDPTIEDTWCVAADGAAAAGLHTRPDGAMLDHSGGPLRDLHPSDRGHFVSHSDIFADMFHLGTDVNVTEVQMEISAL